jgi:hypothetical protein
MKLNNNLLLTFSVFQLVAVALVVEFPEEYPSVLPIVSIEVEKGLGKKHADELRVMATEHAEANVGGPSIFVIAEAIKEWLMDNNNPGQDGSMYAEMMRRVQQKDAVEKKIVDKAAISAAADAELRADVIDPEEQERIRKRQAGTHVTMETFIAWKIKFDDEMKAAADAERIGPVVVVDDRPSGRQIFQGNFVGTNDEDEEALLAAAEGEQEEDQDQKVERNIEEEDDDDDDDEDYVDGEEEDDERDNDDR